MIEPFVVDTNAVIDWMRPGRPGPPQLAGARKVLLPIAVLGELYFGAFSTARPEHHIRLIEAEVRQWIRLDTDENTARVYGSLRAELGKAVITPSKSNDLWIAALCIQHDLPLLTNDRGFERIARLRVVRW